MQSLGKIIGLMMALAFAAGSLSASNIAVSVPAGVDHSAYDALLARYVDNIGLVDYKSWKQNPDDRKALDAYLESFAPESPEKATGNEEVASLINLYNALTLQWILENYPVESIRDTEKPWTERRYLVGGRKISIDDVEHGTLRPLIGWKVHAVVVCAARSCPPLRASAYSANQLEQQIEDAYINWLSRVDLNRFSPADNLAEVSRIFKWYREDYEPVGGVKKILIKYAPARHRQFLKKATFKIDYLPYHWGLNDQNGLGKDY